MIKHISSLLYGVAASFFFFQAAEAQTYRYANEALLLSRTHAMGTARTLSMGGTQVAIGGDLSNAFANPAGLGIYNRSEISISPSLSFFSNDATYQGETSLSDKANFSTGSLGVVFSNRKKDETSGWLGGSFALSYQRTADFTGRMNFTGSDNENRFIDDLSDVFVDDIELVSDYSYLGYETYLLRDYYSLDAANNPIYFTTLIYEPSADNVASQTETLRSEGGMNTFSLAYGGNFSDKVYIGASLNFLGVDLERDRIFTEAFANDIDFDDVNNYRFAENYQLEGSGFSASLGAIIRPIPSLRIGLAYQSPSYLSLHENNYLQLDVDFEDAWINGEGAVVFEDNIEGELTLNGIESAAVESEYDFDLRTPGRFTTGLAYFIEKYGFVSADVEFVDYANARLSDDNNALRTDNQAIREDLQNVFNYRFGAEARYDVLRFRLGYGFEDDPYRNQGDRDWSVQRYSGGLGLRLKTFYADLGVMREVGNRYYIPYANASEVTIDQQNTTAMLTLGLNF